MMKSKFKQRFLTTLQLTRMLSILLAAGAVATTITPETVFAQSIDVEKPPESASDNEINKSLITLPTVTVTAAKKNDAKDGYITSQITTATKTNTLLRDVPQSVSVVTQDIIKDQAIQSMAETVRYVPGMGISQGKEIVMPWFFAVIAPQETFSLMAYATTSSTIATFTT
jgi:outer membrane receptor for ferric coprogen and ferric-rhodotorulic acid